MLRHFRQATAPAAPPWQRFCHQYLSTSVPMTTVSLSNRLVRLGLATVLAITALAASAQAQTAAESRKLDPVLRQRARQLTGHSRVIVQFNTTPDVRVFGSSAAVRPLGERACVAEVDNRLLAATAADPRVDRVTVDCVVFATLERTGAAVGATLVREELGVTGRDIGVAVIDSGVSGWHDDLYHDAARRERVVHFRDFLYPVLRVPSRRSRHIIWGNYRVEGGILLPGSNTWSLDLVRGALQTPPGAPVVWGVQDEDANTVWSTGDNENIVWSTTVAQNVVWGTTAAAGIVRGPEPQRRCLLDRGEDHENPSHHHLAADRGAVAHAA